MTNEDGTDKATAKLCSGELMDKTCDFYSHTLNTEIMSAILHCYVRKRFSVVFMRGIYSAKTKKPGFAA